MIPDSAIEAAHKAWREQAKQDGSIFEHNLRAAIEAAAAHILAGVTALADEWEEQGEYDMAYSKTVTDQDVAIQLLQAGAQMVDDARLIRNAIGSAK